MAMKTYIQFGFGLLGVIGLTCLVYWQGLDGPFILDDQANIFRNFVEVFDRDEIFYAMTHNTSGMLGRPVSMLSLIFTGITYGPTAWGFKYHNLAMHLLNGLLLLWLAIRLLPHFSSRLSDKKVLLVAGFAVTYWLLHPLMVSTVLYAVQRMAQLSTFFTLLALLTYVVARENISSGNTKYFVLSYLLFPSAVLLSIFSKENGALIPLYVFAIELFAFRFSFQGDKDRNRLYCFLAIFVFIPVICGTLYVLTHFDQFTNYSMRSFSLGERLLTQLYVVFLFYPKLIFLPRLADMTLFHDSMQALSGWDPLALVSFCIFVVAIVLIFFLRNKAPLVSFAIAWYLISHLLESSFINLELVFEHRNYLAAFGPMLAVSYYLLTIPRTSDLYKLRYLSLVIIAMITLMTSSRAQEWQSEELLFRIAVNDHPESLRAQSGYATQRYNAGDFNTAIEHLRLGQQFNQEDIGLVLHEALFYCGTGIDGSRVAAEAIAMAEQYPITIYTANVLDNLMGKKRVSECPEVALGDILSLVQTAQSHPRIANNQRYLGYLVRIEALAYLFMGNYEEGQRLYSLAYEYTSEANMLIELIDIQLQVGRLDDAETLLNELIEINESSFGIETARIEILQQRLDNQKAQIELQRQGQN
tara:strand:- start:392905 stop:394830 length:1926 start_codon:yes stop_codon:yes gene_type:complete